MSTWRRLSLGLAVLGSVFTILAVAPACRGIVRDANDKALVRTRSRAVEINAVDPNKLSPEGILVRSYRPSWAVDDTWEVEVSKMSEPPSAAAEGPAGRAPRMVRTTYELKVESHEPYLGEDCFRVRIDCRTVDGNEVVFNRNTFPETFYRIYVRDDYSLKAVERVVMERGGEVVEAARHAARGPVPATGWVERLPMEFPYFDANSMEFEPTNAMGMGTAGRDLFDIGQQKCAVVEAGGSGGNGKALSVTITNPTRGQPDRCRTVEIWRRGLPWWVSAEHTENGKTWSARLVSVNGEEISDISR